MIQRLLFLFKGFVIFSLFSSNLVFAKQIKVPGNQTASYKFRNFSMEDGLSMSTVIDIAQTKDGFMWFATPDKLNRFDGYTFTSFKHEPSNPNSISGNYVNALLALDNGNLMVALQNGMLDIYNPDSKHFTHIKSIKPSQSNIEIRDLVDLGGDRIAIITMGEGICLYHLKTQKSKWFTTANSSIVSDYVQSIAVLNDSVFIYASDQGGGFFNFKKDKFETKRFLEEFSISSLAIIQNKVYVATQNAGLFSLSLPTLQATSLASLFSEDFLYLNMLFADREGKLWIGSTFDGLAMLQNNKQVKVFKKQSDDRYSLINNTIYSAFQDQGGNLWFGTISGISAMVPLYQQFLHYRNLPSNLASLNNNQIYFIYQDKSLRIWIATLEGGINLFEPEKGTFTSFHRENSKGLQSNSIRSIFEDVNQQLWIGTGDKGLYRFNPQKKEFIAVPWNINKYFQTPIRSIYQTPDGIIWVGLQNGLKAFDPKSNTMVLENELDKISTLNSTIYEIKRGNSPNTLWIATAESGVLELDWKKIAISRHFYAKENATTYSLSNNYAMCMYQYNKDTMLVGTFGGGLNILDLQNGKTSVLTENEGLPNDAVYGILRDNMGKVWVSTNKGLARICLDCETTKISKFDFIEQVQSLEFNEGAFMKDAVGHLYFGGINGLNVIIPPLVKLNEKAPKIYLTQVSLFDKPLVIGKNKEIKLRHNQNFLGFEFVGLDFTNPHKISYAYKMEGVDEDWVDGGNRKFVQYAALRSGNYTFKVKAVNEEGIESEEIASVSFNILPPFWLRWWFIGGVALLILAIALLIYKSRTNKLRKEFQFKLSELELKALRSQMNPHFIFNSINSIQYYILNKNPQIAYTYLAKFSNLMRRILQNSRINYISLEEELESLNLYMELENIRMEGELKYSVEVAPNLSTKNTFIPSMILQPYVENAILHGLLSKQGDKEIQIRVKKEISHLYCEIEDNGIGREKAIELNNQRTKKHESTAMKATKERLEILNHGSENKLSIHIIDKKDSKGNALGTKVQVFIPIIKQEDTK